MAFDSSSSACRTDEDIYPRQCKEQVPPSRQVMPIGDRGDIVLVRQATTSNLELGGNVGSGDQAVVADLDEAGGQDMQQEPAHELDCIDGGRLSVLGAEADVVPVEADETLVGEADPMGVTAEILEDVLGSAEGTLA